MLTINQFLPKYCSVLLRDDYREYEEILKQYYRDLQEVSGETVWGFCKELVPEFFRWYEDCFGKMEG